MKYVYVLKRHPWSRINGGYLLASLIVDVFERRKDAVAIAKEKNKISDHLWVVTRKAVK